MSSTGGINVTVSHLSPMIQYWPGDGWWEETLEDSSSDSADNQLLVRP